MISNLFAATIGMLSLGAMLGGCTSNQLVPDPVSRKSDGGVMRTVLLSSPEYFCSGTEWSAPVAYIRFALQVDGHIRYFRTKTTCDDFKGVDSTYERYRRFMTRVIGEQVLVYGGDTPTKLRRESGELYDLGSSETSLGQVDFLPSRNAPEYENPKNLGVNPHPDAILAECRLLTDSTARNLCLYYQAGLQNDQSICSELTGPMKEKCIKWVENIRAGKIDE